MKKIVLVCAGGMSTSILVNNMKKEVKERGLEFEIEAYPVDTVKKTAEDAQCVLLGPQVAYKLDEVKSQVKCPVADIDLPTYGLMDGAKTLDLALSIMEKE